MSRPWGYLSVMLVRLLRRIVQVVGHQGEDALEEGSTRNVLEGVKTALVGIGAVENAGSTQA